VANGGAMSSVHVKRYSRKRVNLEKRLRDTIPVSELRGSSPSIINSEKEKTIRKTVSGEKLLRHTGRKRTIAADLWS